MPYMTTVQGLHSSDLECWPHLGAPHVVHALKLGQFALATFNPMQNDILQIMAHDESTCTALDVNSTSSSNTQWGQKELGLAGMLQCGSTWVSGVYTQQ